MSIRILLVDDHALMRTGLRMMLETQEDLEIVGECETGREAIQRAKGDKEPIEFLIENAEYFQTYRIDYHGGESYPHLERNGEPDLLSEIARMKAPAVPPAKE